MTGGRIHDVEALLEDIYDLSDGLIRGGVTQGSLYPPTAIHRRDKKRLEEALDKMQEKLKADTAAIRSVIEKYR